MDQTGKKIRILLSKSVQDGHESALRYIAQTLRDAGMEVIYMRHEMIEDVVKTAAEEDVDVIGLQYFGAGVMYEVPIALDLLKQKKMEDIKVVLGGTITPDEKKTLKEMGVAEVFLPSQGKVIEIPAVIRNILDGKQ
jgi:methylmalonyl-CoA mutase C-terminal domain/subunit